MIQIGRSRLVAVKTKDDRTGKLVPLRSPDGEIVKRTKLDCVERLTRQPLGHGFGPDSKRQLVVRLVATDQIEFKPYKTQRPVRANIRDLYRYILMCQAQAENLRKARDRKAKIAERRARRRLESAEKRLSERARREQDEEFNAFAVEHL